jgi:uncharacterized protein YlaI
LGSGIKQARKVQCVEFTVGGLNRRLNSENRKNRVLRIFVCGWCGIRVAISLPTCRLDLPLKNRAKFFLGQFLKSCQDLFVSLRTQNLQ